ncbi:MULTISPECIES: glycoside hydrolase family 97 catalytic domain-containing protein [unclassified Microbulbifer]|uniref:glycoside hydrolase family 97 protein n=1 Tax=unclassified Microbulbifer TaxID=2619833 RepID=UPI0027E4B0EE|nr:MULTISPECIES: glycoside hydrolase family 97 catalytic domain-containing protein [unclassified Microbulbifer]
MNVKKRQKMSLLLALALSSNAALALQSPNKQLDVSVSVNADKTLTYSITRNGEPVLLSSPLGLKLEGADFSREVKLVHTSPVKTVTDRYTLAVGKRRVNQYKANEQVYSVVDAAGHKMDVEFRVSDDGVAFRYVVADPSLPTKRFLGEETSFAFKPTTRAFLQAMTVARTGYGQTNPSYEERYQVDTPVGQPAPMKAGWVFPALFKSGDTWVALTEANMDGSFHASRLATDSPNGVYQIDGPTPLEVFTHGKLLAETTGTLTTPWRVIALGSLNTVMDSTLGTDLAAPAIPFDTKQVQPGHASWSWALLKDGATVFDVQKKFIDYAADMKWDYTLVDAEWDKQIGYEKVAELARYASSKGVGLLVWYNSAGDWNEAMQTPRAKLLTHASRVQEFARLREMGVKGVKIDFFGGDGVSMIQYYVDILKDAADAGLVVNFHGATLPRGLQRTYPNLMTVEAIRGLEFTTFAQTEHDAVPGHVVNATMIRSLFDPMDFTPMVFGDIPNIQRITRNGFELAQSVLFLSGIQHFAEVPEGMATVPQYVRDFLGDLPRSWNDSRFLAGYPDSHVVIARKAGEHWYVAGVNAEDSERTLDLDLSFIGKRKGTMITDGAGQREFTQTELRAGKARVTVKPRGGFVAVFR